jgi:hypothetical protein
MPVGSGAGEVAGAEVLAGCVDFTGRGPRAGSLGVAFGSAVAAAVAAGWVPSGGGAGVTVGGSGSSATWIGPSPGWRTTSLSTVV